MDRHFSKEDIQRANGYVEKYSASLIIRGMQTETAVRHHFTFIIKNPKDKGWQGVIGTLGQCWWECETVQSPQKTVWKFL